MSTECGNVIEVNNRLTICAKRIKIIPWNPPTSYIMSKTLYTCRELKFLFLLKFRSIVSKDENPYSDALIALENDLVESTLRNSITVSGFGLKMF